MHHGMVFKYGIHKTLQILTIIIQILQRNFLFQPFISHITVNYEFANMRAGTRQTSPVQGTIYCTIFVVSCITTVMSASTGDLMIEWTDYISNKAILYGMYENNRPKVL